MIRLLDDRSGSVITVFSFSAMVLAVLTAIVMNQISFYTAKRNLQAAVDMTCTPDVFVHTWDLAQAAGIDAANAVQFLP